MMISCFYHILRFCLFKTLLIFLLCAPYPIIHFYLGCLKLIMYMYTCNKGSIQKQNNDDMKSLAKLYNLSEVPSTFMLDDVSVLKAYELIAEINSNQYNYVIQSDVDDMYNKFETLIESSVEKSFRKKKGKGDKHCEVTNIRFVLVEPDSMRFHHDIIFCLESDTIVVSLE